MQYTAHRLFYKHEYWGLPPTFHYSSRTTGNQSMKVHEMLSNEHLLLRNKLC